MFFPGTLHKFPHKCFLWLSSKMFSLPLACSSSEVGICVALDCRAQARLQEWLSCAVYMLVPGRGRPFEPSASKGPFYRSLRPQRAPYLPCLKPLSEVRSTERCGFCLSLSVCLSPFVFVLLSRNAFLERESFLKIVSSVISGSPV